MGQSTWGVQKPSMTEYTIVLVRHGESEWNEKGLFTGWYDADLNDTGRAEAKAAGVALKSAGLVFDAAYTSVLKRAIKTCWTILEEMDLCWIPVTRDYRLNERMYGGLTGMDKKKPLRSTAWSRSRSGGAVSTCRPPTSTLSPSTT